MTPERRIWLLGHVFMALLLLVSARIVYWQLVRGPQLVGFQLDPVTRALDTAQQLRSEGASADEIMEALKDQSDTVSLEELPQPLVQRTVDQLENVVRGSIFDRNGRLLAYDTLEPDGSYRRVYTEPSLGNTLGYVSGVRIGITGLEATYNDTLLGLNRVDAQVSQIIHAPVRGSDLVLTIDSYVQRVAAQALGDRAGAVVVFDGDNGSVLGLVSSPSYDPNRILDAGYVESLVGGNAPFLNRATQALYTPGSTFKTVTLIGALDTGLVTPETVFDFGEPVQGPNGPYYVYEVDGGIIPDPNHRENRLDLPMSYARSANAAFARMGHEMDPQAFVNYGQKLGFSAPNPADYAAEIPFSPSLLAVNTQDLLDNNLLRAATAIGQGELFATPWQMAMVVLPVVNEGSMPLPFLVDTILEPSGLEKNGLMENKSIRGIMQAATAQQVHDMMVTVVESGSGGGAALSGVTVGGKTGTAQLGGDQAPHAWFIGFAEADGETVVIAVMVENGGSGASVAAPIFAAVADAALRGLGTPVDEIVPGLPNPVPQE